jgi:bacillithiol biosynthesis cysteine-adding enzyme BshC
MDCTSTRLPYRQTAAFSKLVMDYIDQADQVKPFYQNALSVEGIQKAIKARQHVTSNRELLVAELKVQYGELSQGKLKDNLDSLLSPNTFTITTAHQPNILTGPLYFIYKILHAIRLADQVKAALPSFDFVPVYYMGCEDADLDELGHIHIDGKKLKWETSQTGAVGRMVVDKPFLQLIDTAEGQLSVLPFGKEILSGVKECYQDGTRIQDATFKFVNALFADLGLVILVPDNAKFKQQAADIFKDDLLQEKASQIVSKSIDAIQAAGYKVQANPREINLFYLEAGIRERIVRRGNEYRVKGTDLKFSEAELLLELSNHPERFSPNVILRGIFQELLLPNVAFIGGGGEIAYWLQYGAMFDHYKVPLPVLVLRNSFMVVEKPVQEKIAKLGFTVEDFFLPERELLNRLVARSSSNQTSFNGSLTKVEQMYELFKQQAGQVDTSLTKHVEALKSKAVYRLQELEKKMLRAEKRKYTDQLRQIQHIKSILFPGGGLQERYDNILYYYAKWGKEFMSCLYSNSLSTEQEFVILSVKK